jgi:hypothetical protein
MKSATLASLLITSAAAGAAAAGGPFFFAQTCPMAVAFSTQPSTSGQFYSTSASVVVAEDFVVTDFSCGGSTANYPGPADYAILVDGEPKVHWRNFETFSGSVSPKSASSKSLSFADGAGIPVPAGSTLTIEASQASYCSVIGYHF